MEAFLAPIFGGRRGPSKVGGEDEESTGNGLSLVWLHDNLTGALTGQMF